MQSAVRPLNHTDLLDAKEHVKPPVANLEQYMETMGEELVEELNAASEMVNNRDVLDALASHAATRRGGVQ